MGLIGRGEKDIRIKIYLTSGLEGTEEKAFIQTVPAPLPTAVLSDASCLEELFWTDSLKMTHWPEQRWGRFSAFYSKGVIGPPASLKLRFLEVRPLSLLTWFTFYTFYQRRIAAFLILSCKTLFQMYKILYPHDVSWLFPGLRSQKYKKL